MFTTTSSALNNIYYMEIKKIASQIREQLDSVRKDRGLTFTEEGHKYTIDGLDKIVSTTAIVSRYYEPFDGIGLSMRLCDQNEEKAAELRAEWAEKGRVARHTGSYVHYHLEKHICDRFELDKELREPHYEMDEDMIKRGDKMIEAGKNQVQAMVDRGGYIIDTEVVLGSAGLGYVGQCDCAWVGLSKDGEYKIMLTDWKTNKPKKFQKSIYDKPMYEPFTDMTDNAIGKYSLQLALYENLVFDMLNMGWDLSPSIIVSLRQRPKGTYVEYGVSPDIRNKALYLKI